MTLSPGLTNDALPVTGQASDRLPPMLFLAALFHALIILGIAFDPGLTFRDSESLTLDVVVLTETDQRIERPDDAAYLAAVSQLGKGNTELEVDPGRLPSGQMVIPEFTELLGDLAPDESLEDLTNESIVAHKGDTRQQADEAESANDIKQASAPQVQPPGAGETLPVPENLRNESRISNNSSRELVFGVDTRETVLAQYLAIWKARVETEGTQYFNDQIRGITVRGAPVIEVAINADGSLAEIIVGRSSGDARIDQAALNVLRKAAPYQPIPHKLRKDYDSLRFRYIFQFETEGTAP